MDGSTAVASPTGSTAPTAGAGEMLTVKEYAAMKRVHEETVKRWCRQGLVPCERTGRLGHWRIKHVQEAA